MVGRVGRDEGQSVAEALQVSGLVPSPFVHPTAVKVLSGNNGSSFLLEQVGKVGFGPSVSPVEALDS